MDYSLRTLALLVTLACYFCATAHEGCGQTISPQPAHSQALTDDEWTAVDRSIDNAVHWLMNSQQRDGSFPSLPHGQPAVTSLGVLAMLAQGELPERGEHGTNLSEAIDYVLSCQKPSGLLAAAGPGGKELSHNVSHTIGQTSVYNHAISALMLSEAYGTTKLASSQRIQQSIERAVRVTLDEQRRRKRRQADHGGWRYLDQFSDADADLSVIGWQLMFLRSAKNSGFDVPKSAIDDAVACVRRHFSQRAGRFSYTPGSPGGSRAMTGAGILALAHAGMHDTPEAKRAGDTMRNYSFARYNSPMGDSLDRYHYSLFQCTQAAYQLGEDYWQQFHPPKYRTLLANQNSDGSWPAEQTRHGDGRFGNAYTTALVILSLSAPNQLLPIYQR